MRVYLLILALALTNVARANVLVYKGVATCLLPNDVAHYSKKPHFYFVVDLGNNTAYSIFFFTLNGTKDQENLFPINPTRYNSGPLANKTLGTFTFAFDDGGAPNNFGNAMLYLRGKEVPLQIRTGVIANYPKTLTGTYRAATNTGSLAFNDEINFVLTFDALHTQAANNVFKSGATTSNDINAELTAKGY